MDDGIFHDVIQQLTQEHVELGGAEDDGGAVDADAPLIRLVNQIIVDAFKLRASDIHLEPLEKRFRLRYRIDGVMQEMKSAAETAAAFHHRAPEDPGQHGHLRAPRPAGRAHPDQRWGTS